MKLRVPETLVDVGHLRKTLARDDKVSITVTLQTKVSSVKKPSSFADERIVYLREREGEEAEVVHILTVREGHRED